MSSTEPPRWGTRSLLALAIATVDLPVISRRTLRALLPETGTYSATLTRRAHLSASMGRSANSNRTTVRFQKILAEFEALGLLVRGSEYVRILDREAIASWLDEKGPWPEPPPLSFRQALDEVTAQPAPPSSAAFEQRVREMDMLRRLMQQVNVRPGRVRILNRSYP